MADDSLLLHGYWRSSSSYRVRIALNLKGLAYRQQAVNLVRDGGEQNLPGYRAVNPLGLVPALTHGEHVIVQSVAICEYLEETFPAPALLPPDARGRARVRTIVQTIADEIQPLNNLAVLKYLADDMRQNKAAISQWYQRWVDRGFSAIEAWLNQPETGECCHGDQPTLADCFLVPQLYNAERFDCDLSAYPRLLSVAGHCRGLEPFRAAAPDNQPDAA